MSEIDDILKGAPEHKPGAGSTKAASPATSEIDQALKDAPAPARGFKGWAQDVAATAVKGAIGVPEALVGLADIPTGGAVGKFLENEGGAVGFRPKQAKEIANQWHSDATLEAQRKVQEAEGLGGKFKAAIENPSVIATAIGESLPSMGAGGVAARGLLAATRLGKMGAGGAALAGAIGEGVTGAGSAAEQIRQETPDGLLTPEQAALAGATGLATTAFGAAGGKLATKLGIGDAETMLAQGANGIGTEAAQQSALKSVPKAVIQGAISEGLLEELPQSVAEQILQNIALGKDWSQDVDSAAVLGVLSGGVMGGGAAGLNSTMQPRTPAPAAPGTPPNPGLERVRSEFNARLADLNQQEAGEPAVPQVAPPDGRAVLNAQEARAKAERDAAIAASRAVTTPDDEIFQSTGANNPPKRSEQMGLNPAVGTLSASAAVAVDTGAADHVQQQADAKAKAEADADTTGVPVVDYADLTDEDRAAVDDYYRRMDEETRQFIGMGMEDDDGLPDFDTKGDPSTENFLRSLGASEQEIQDAISTTSAPAGPLQGAASNGAAAPDVAGSAQQGAGTAETQAQGQVQGLTATPPATTGEPANGTQTPQAVQAAPQGSAQPAPAAQPTAWDGLSTAQRGEVAARAGLPKILAANIPGAAWDQINPNTRAKLEAAMVQPAAPTADVQATKPSTDTASTAVEPQAAGRAGVSGVDQQGAVQALNDEWKQFPQETGTLNVPRSEMPQVKTSHRGPMVNFLNARGVSHESVEVDPATLKPTQAEFSQTKVQEAADRDTDRSILISADGHIIDGHHQALAKLENGKPVRAIRLNATAEELITLVREFPSSTTEQADVQDAQNQTTGTETKAAPVEAQPAETGNAPAAAGVPAAPGASDVQTDGVKAKKTARGVLAKMADQKRTAALDRIAKGTAYFGTKEKADEFITKSGIGDTHEVVSAKPGRFEIRAKEAAAPAAASQPKPKKQPEASTAAAPASQKAPAEPPKRKALLLRAVGQKMAEQGAADQSRDRNTNTARRASMAASADADARKREAMGKTLMNLADAIESGEATKLAGITTKAQVEALEKALVRGMIESERGLSYVDQQRQKGRAPTEQDVRNARFPKLSWSNGGADSARLLEAIKGKKGSKEVADMLRFGPPRAEQLAALKKLGVTDSVLQSGFGWWNIEMMAEVGRLERAGIKTDEDLRGAIAEYIEYRDGPKKEDPIKAAERKLIGQKVGLDFFPTPKAVADRMVQAAGIEPGMRVLEPSAGNGNLADAAKAAGAEVDAVEVSDALREVLSAKGYELAGRDFLSFEPTEKYDAIIMNPPFSNRLDAEHIQRAFGMLKPGARLVAIAGEGVFNGVDKKAQAFRAWLEEVGASVEKLPAATFKDVQLLATTGANARLIEIEAPQDSTAQVDAPSSKKISALSQRRGEDAPAEEAAAVQSAIEGKSLVEAAKFVADTGSAAQREVATMVVKKLQAMQEAGVNLELKVAHRGEQVPQDLIFSRGYTEIGMDEKGADVVVWLNSADVTSKVGTDYETLLHELVHAATAGAMRHAAFVKDSPYGDALKSLESAAQAIGDHITSRFEKADAGEIDLTEFEQDIRAQANNAFTNLDEVVSWALTSREAQDYLDGIPYKSGSLWTRFVRAVRSALGLPAESETVLSEVLRAAEKLMNPQDESARFMKAFWHKRGIRMGTQQAKGSVVLINRNFSSTAEQPTKSVTVEAAQEVADKALSTLGLNGVVPIRAFSKASDAGIAAPEGVIPMGTTVDGRIFLFAENLADELAVFRTVFHELFHLGLSKTVSQGAYIQTMLGFLSDPQVRTYANRWKQTADGVSRKGTMPVNNWQALAVEEALSDIAEDMNADRDGTGTKHAAWVGRMASRLASLADAAGLKAVAERIRAFTRTEAEQFVQAVMRRAGDAQPVQLRGQRFSQPKDAAEDNANFGTKDRREGSPADRAVMAMAGEGRSADEILRFIANASKSPFNRQVARLLRRTGANPAVSLGGDMGGGAGFRFLAKYSRKNHEVTLSEGASDRAEQIFLHETVHSATLLALDRGGDHAAQMQRLYEAAKKQGGADGMYGMKNVGEFVAEAFTNPEFQKALKGMRAPGATVWDRFVAAVRRILGLPDQSQDALSVALELGAEVMRENMPLRAAKSFRAEDAPAFAGVDQTETPEFKRWFGDSKVVDSAGKPLVVYHGTSADFDSFNPDNVGDNFGLDKEGFFFTGSTIEASGYADPKSQFLAAGMSDDRKKDPRAGSNVMPVYLSMQNPLTLEAYTEAFYTNPIVEIDERGVGLIDYFDDNRSSIMQFAKDGGHDGVLFRRKGKLLAAAFRPEQIKSATGNRGTFDPEDADIAHFGMADGASIKQSALDQIHQSLSHPGKVSVWDKTVGTMRNLAERSPAFKPVFEAAQRFIDDVSMLANETADVAPRLLPRVESWRDLTKKPVSAEDNQAISKPLFEGTLMWARDTDGKPVLVDDMAKKYADLSTEKRAKMLMAAGRLDDRVLRMWQGLPEEQFDALVNSRFESQMLKPGVIWSDSELRSLFDMNDQQISLYREARKAIDRSIDLTARADMLRAVGTEYGAMRDVVLEAPSLGDARDLLVDTLHADALEDESKADRLTALINTVGNRYESAVELITSGYAPLSRFGRYTVDVVDAAGERQYFGMSETVRDANQMADRLRAEFPGATVTQGTMSAEAYKLFAGITPESLELFGNMLGLDAEGGDARDKAFQEYLRLSKNNHSALKRLMHRKGIAGYSEDVGRVLASFTYSNARQAAGGLNAGTVEESINAIPKEQGELKDVAMGLRDYVRDPQEEGQAVRGMLFAQYLGGSVASAFVNMTQPMAVTLPWLSQYGGMKAAGAQLARAVKDMAGKATYEADLQTALGQAEEDGIVSPQEIHQLMAQARGAGTLRSGDGTRVGNARAAASNAWERTKVAWGQPFALAEQFNRRSTFIAAYRLAKDRGIRAPAQFARRAVLETQFLYSKANKPKWARGAVGGTLFTFKTYSVSYLELMNRMWTQGGPEGKRAVGWALATMMLMGGAGGLPFMEDLEDLIDGIAQLMGYNVSAKQWRRQALQDIVGKEMAEFVDTGVSGLPGAPIDVSGRMGMGDLIPGTGMLLSKPDHSRDLLEVVGPAGDLVSRGFTGARKVLTGDVGGAALELSPSAVRNAAKGIDMAISDRYTDAKGYKVLDTTLPEAAAKFAGFQPRSVAKVQEANGFMMRSKSFYTQTSAEIKAEWARALFEKDDGALQDVRDRLADWNRKNPEQQIVVKMPDVWKRVREMGKDRTQRIADTAPKALRQELQAMAKES